MGFAYFQAKFVSHENSRTPIASSLTAATAKNDEKKQEGKNS